MISAFSRIRDAGIDDSHRLTSLDKGYQEKALRRGQTRDDLSHFTYRMIGIIMDTRQRIEEDRDRFIERYAVLPEVGRLLLWVPRELHSSSLRHSVGRLVTLMRVRSS